MARENFVDIKRDTERQVGERLQEIAMSSMAEDVDVASRRSQQAAACGTSLAALQHVERLLDVARNAHVKLGEAEAACKSASTMEVMDAFSSNKAISAMSHMKTSAAKTKLNDAKCAVEALSLALPKSRQKLDAETPDDFLDLVLDFADFPIDFMSWLNKVKLDTAAKKCGETQERIAKVIGDLCAIEAERRRVYEQGTSLLAEIDRPYLMAALEFVPQAIRFAVPQHLTT
ncbi:hypothetical protein HFN89_01085 [Rhizobium laguerreae]|nr:hypothetical protein [Rhizobium laguerreae]